MRNIKCADCAEYRNEWCEKVIDSPHPDMLRDCQYFHEKDGNGQERKGTDKHFVGDSKKVIDGLKMTMDLFLFNPSTGETLAPDDLNELNRITYDACKGAIELLSLQSEQQNCPYCHEDADGYLMPLEKNIHIYMRPTLGTWTLHFRANGWSGGCVIQYCPMCGRRLEHG